jgi:BTB/POZ domain-containing protein KCTD9
MDWMVRGLPKPKKLTLTGKGGFWILKQGFFITLAVGTIRYITETDKRQKLAHYQAWQMINSATGQKTSGGRIEALQDLVKDGVVLVGLDASGADLGGIKLQKAFLGRANLRNTKLYNADLRNASLWNANLHDADLRFAILHNADLDDANLRNALLKGIDLRNINFGGVEIGDAKIQCNINNYCTNLKGAKNITPKQIKKASYWQSACYDPDFRIKLGLPPENPKQCAGEPPTK